MTCLSRATDRPALWPLLLGLCLVTWLAGLALALPYGVDGAVQRWEGQVNSQIVIALPVIGKEAPALADSLPKALTATFPETHATLLPEQEVSRLLAAWSAPWEGPLPRILTLSYHGDMTRLAAFIHSTAPEAIIVPPPPQLTKLTPLMTVLQQTARHVALMAGLAAALIVPALLYLAARTVALANRQQQAVLWRLGGKLSVLHRIFARRVALMAFLGSLAGIVLLLPSLGFITAALHPLLRLPPAEGSMSSFISPSLLPVRLWLAFSLMPVLMALAGWAMVHLVCARQGQQAS